MKILDFYLTKLLIKNILLALLVLSLIFILINFVEELSEVGNHQYTIPRAGIYSLLQIPSIIYLLGNIAVVLGAIVSVGSLNSSKELQIFLTGSLSLNHVAKTTIIVSLLLSILFSIFGEFGTSYFSKKADIYKSRLLHKPVKDNQSSIFIWSKQDNKFIRVKRDNIRNSSLIEEFEIDHIDLKSYKTYELDSSDDKSKDYVLENITFSNSNVDKRLKFIKLQNENIEDTQSIHLPLENFETARHPKDMSLPDLIYHIYSLNKLGRQSKNYQAELLLRVFRPINAISLIFIALPMVMRFERNYPLGSKIFVSIFLVLMFNILIKTFSNIILKINFNQYLSMFLVTLFILMLSYKYFKNKINSQ